MFFPPVLSFKLLEMKLYLRALATVELIIACYPNSNF